MPAKAVITAPFPSVEETAREMGVADQRVRQLRRLVTAIVEGRDGRVVRFLAPRERAVRKAKKKVTAKRRVAAHKRTTRR